MSTTISPETFAFLKQLEANNNREWFNAHKDEYLTANQNVLQFVEELLEQMGSFDETILKLDPKKTLFRIYRDTRFSQNKDPYKTNFGASINGIGKKTGGAGYYLHIQPKSCFMAAGVYRCEPAQLKKIRQNISANPDEFSSIVNHKDFKDFEFNNEKLARVPQGFEKEDLMAEYLKMKNVVASTAISDKDLQNKNAVEICSNIFQKMSPLVNFLNSAILS